MDPPALFWEGLQFCQEDIQLGTASSCTYKKVYSKVQADPRFTEASFLALRAAVLSARKQNREVIDEISIRKHTQWDGKKLEGLVNLGCGTMNQSDAVPLGK